jgi:hypothetical protein
MGKVGPVQPVTPVLGVLYRDEAVVDDAMLWVEMLLGDVDLHSEVMPFTQTDYYDAEMGEGLKRRFYSFDRLSDPTLLSHWKLETNKIEEQAAQRFGEYRPINLDPGYIRGPSLVLATVKGLSHRVPIGGGIFAEVTLTWRNGTWQPMPWTFPDYASGAYDKFLNLVRERHLELMGARV